MKAAKILRACLLACAALLPLAAAAAPAESNRQERNLIKEGNKLYNSKEYAKALNLYRQALKENPSSLEALYNEGISAIRLSEQPECSEENRKKYLQAGSESMSKVAQAYSAKPGLASRACYNLGNLAFKTDDLRQAQDLYKQALRLDPGNDAARRNLRIVQKKLQQQNQDQDKNKDQQQNKDQDKNQDQQQDKKQEQQQQPPQQDKQDKKDQQPPKENEMTGQTADQILKAVENKEEATRRKYNGQGMGTEKSRGYGKGKNW